MENEILALKDVFMGALLAQRHVLGMLVSSNPQVAQTLQRIDPDKFEAMLLTCPLSDEVIRSAKLEIARLQQMTQPPAPR